MLTFESFTGINNVLPAHRLQGADLIKATDVNIGQTGEITRRQGFTEVSALCHKNLFDGQGFMLSTAGNQLVATHPGGVRHVVHPAIGPERLWYCNLPDGRTAFSNGLIQGTTDGFVSLDRSVPEPTGLGAPDTAFGELFPGAYRYYLTHVRLADGAESPALGSAPVTIVSGGLRIDGLPQLSGHSLSVYLSNESGEGAYLVGAGITGDMFQFGGKNAQLVTACRTIGVRPFPVGTITAYWRGRVLVAQGDVLWASRPFAPHLADWRDFKPLKDRITAIQPVDDGVFVGTDKELVFLAGTTWESLTYRSTRRGPVVLGSGVSAPGDQLRVGDGAGSGDAMLCIAGGEIVAGFAGGVTSSLTQNRYKTTAAEVCVTFRVVDEIPQYVAVPQ
ncbi:hypothetical protein LJR074_002204 [Acidovorax sp. LjRoot74]|uniref:hypothetical protein n=1 Tax=Acidovorax sp. LjRoot74 TaxID=3342337 RepID=UPI003ED14B22